VHKGQLREAPVPVRPRARTSVRERAAAKASAAAEGVDATPARRDEIVLGPHDAALFAALKTLRGTIARAEQVPAYVVFPDRTLAEFAVRRPRSLAGLSDVRGVGPAKLEKYGERFLAVIREANDTEAA
jgi:ATP-dependent DNA helicase RecQ